jgi:hypothetical protein
MKKKATEDQETTPKPRRLRLKRETIRSLDDPALLGEARGGTVPPGCPTTSQTFEES